MRTKRVQSRHTALTISVDELSLRRNEFRDGLADVGLAGLQDARKNPGAHVETVRNLSFGFDR